MMDLDGRSEVFGREQEKIDTFGKKGCGYMGKIVSYPGGRYEEMGSVHMDLTSPHCMLILGKRGTGKSYSMGVMIENFAELEEEVRDRISLIVVDTMSVFHGLKAENTDEEEVSRLVDFEGLEPRGYGDDVDIYVPELSIKEYSGDRKPVHDSKLKFRLDEVDVEDWLSLFDLGPTESAGILIWDVIDDLKSRGGCFDFEDIYDELEGEGETGKAVKNFFKHIEKLEVFTEEDSSFDELASGGKISVLDMSCLGRIKGYDVRNLLVSVIAKKLLRRRTLYSSLETQADADMLDEGRKDEIQRDPVMYMMIDEAHLFLPEGDETLSSDVLIDWIKVGRNPGLSLIMATQEPSALHESAIRQSDMILSHSLTSHDDIEALGKARQSYMSKGKDIQSIVSKMDYKRGLAVLFDDRTRKMERCMVRPRRSLHTGRDASALHEDI